MHLLDQWTQMPPARRRLARQAAVALPVAIAAIRSLGTDRARHMMPRLPWRLRRSDAATEVGWAIEAVGRRVPGARCLAKAVAAEAILDRAGRAPDMHIGARRSSDGELEAHAWVEVGGSVVVGADEREAFSRLEPPPGTHV